MTTVLRRVRKNFGTMFAKIVDNYRLGLFVEIIERRLDEDDSYAVEH